MWMRSLHQTTKTASEDKEFDVEVIKEEFFVKHMLRETSTLLQSLGRARIVPCRKMGTNQFPTLKREKHCLDEQRQQAKW